MGDSELSPHLQRANWGLLSSAWMNTSASFMYPLYFHYFDCCSLPFPTKTNITFSSLTVGKKNILIFTYKMGNHCRKTEATRYDGSVLLEFRLLPFPRIHRGRAAWQGCTIRQNCRVLFQSIKKQVCIAGFDFPTCNT